MSMVNGIGSINAASYGYMPKIREPSEEAPSKLEEPTRRNLKRDEYIPGKAGEKVTVNTDKVDSEIRKLKQKISELERQLSSETDPAKQESIRKQLAALEKELKSKDNDSYRRKHSEFCEAK